MGKSAFATWDVTNPIVSTAKLNSLVEAKRHQGVGIADAKERELFFQEVARLEDLERERIGKISKLDWKGLRIGVGDIYERRSGNGKVITRYEVVRFEWAENEYRTHVYVRREGYTDDALHREYLSVITAESAEPGFRDNWASWKLVRRAEESAEGQTRESPASNFQSLLEEIMKTPPEGICLDAWKSFVSADQERAAILRRDVKIVPVVNRDVVLARFEAFRKNPPEELRMLHEKHRAKGWWEKS